MLTVTTWLWGDKYGPDYVAKLAGGIRRHLKQRHRFICFSDQGWDQDIDGVETIPILPEDRHLTEHRGCFVRLRMFDPLWQQGTFMSTEFGADRIVCVDLDAIVTGPLDPIFDRQEPFVILQGANSANPCPYNGSVMMLRVGEHPEVWRDFSLEAARAVPFYEFPDDQGWLAHKVPGAAGWKAGVASGIYAFQKPGWPKGESLPADASLVVFPGWRDPLKFRHLDWVKEHWR